MKTLIALALSFLAVCVSYVVAQTSGGGEPFAERAPADFADRYGSARSSRNLNKHTFLDPTRGAVEITGQFNVREFRSGDLRIQAVFFRPSLKLAAVRLALPRLWTVDQIEAALAAYSADWKPSDANPVVKTWETPFGARAINALVSVEIQSPEIVQRVARALQEADAKRKVIPKF